MDDSSKMLCSASDVQSAVRQLAADICKLISSAPGECALVGIHQQGVPLAGMIKEVLEKEFGCSPDFGTLDISMYRDDIGVRKVLPPIRETWIPFDIEGGVVILTDAILQSGRTIRAALDAVTDFGRPAMIRLATMIDRGMREFPIRADYVGAHIDAPADKKLSAKWTEYNQTDGVFAIPKVKQ